MKKCHENCKHYGGDAEQLIKLSFIAVFGLHACSKWLLCAIVARLLLSISFAIVVFIICLLLFAFMASVSLIIEIIAWLSDLKKLFLSSFLHLHHGGFGFHGMFFKSTMGAMFFIKWTSVFLSFNYATKIRIKETRIGNWWILVLLFVHQNIIFTPNSCPFSLVRVCHKYL